MIAPGNGSDIIYDFVYGEDLLALSGLTMESLKITDNSSYTRIATMDDEILATLKGVAFDTITDTNGLFTSNISWSA